jgi:diaminohydroxyphosphoribosylaminopyrimidine deaminase / 5-amino-6-(5-phosphoribosylamino)uracil reductase
VTLKVASTLDGRIADASGRSRWITGDRARREVHRLRFQADAVLVGSGTVLSDDPMLTVRGLGKSSNPLRIVLDPELITPVEARIVHSAPEGKTVLVTSPGTDERKKGVLEDKGVRFLALPSGRGNFPGPIWAPPFLSWGFSTSLWKADQRPPPGSWPNPWSGGSNFSLP